MSTWKIKEQPKCIDEVQVNNLALFNICVWVESKETFWVCFYLCGMQMKNMGMFISRRKVKRNRME